MSAAATQREPYGLCPLCGFEFKSQDTLCHHGCPLHAQCRLMRCPAGGYECPAVPGGPAWLRRLFRRRPAPPGNGEACGLRSLTELRAGDRGEVVRVGREHEGARRSTLSLYGLVPGGEVTLVQRRPACVVRIGETELALDFDVAAGILVRQSSASTENGDSGSAAQPSGSSSPAGSDGTR